ncbi:hypothetical protein E4T66_06290 [Sinimarinibacterium sp. CAU 1509]|uniref:OmpP1/FadL family transporter n=1 Tax=Sinimarinibacterium sp. CAU 1509 TaxID=2562283 RepID=UPI0010ABD75A|nr:outer membrane protein transport protein [Sinimarinibacterium sp. CAU 1509]TJY63304.1 hypothetical protein E4T66_06290 [Sinimarinibacterium sp. CAU 1509]
MRLLATLMVTLSAESGQAFNGLSMPGLGVNQVGMAGAGTALLSDSAATLRNPAAGAFLQSGSTWDLLLGLPTAGYSASATADDSRFSLFEFRPGTYRSVYMAAAAPTLSSIRRVSDRWAWGLGLYGAGLGSTLIDGSANIGRGIPTLSSECQGDFAGGMALTPTSGSSQCGLGTENAGIQATQVISSAYLSFRPWSWMAVGAAPLVVTEQLRIRGLSAFAPYAVEEDRVTDRGYEFSWGLGYRLGLHLRPIDELDFGMSYQPRVQMTTLERYRGVIQGGNLDVPSNLNFGLHLKLSPNQSVMVDLDEIHYSEVQVLRSSPDLQEFVNRCLLPRLIRLSVAGQEDSAYCLGGSQGPGFGWGDTTIFKIGYEMRADRWSWRAGYSAGGSPVRIPDAVMTTLVPAVVDKHLAVGASWAYSPRLNIGLALSYAIQGHERVRNGLSNIQLETSGVSGIVGALLGDGALLQADVGRDASDQTVDIYMDTWELQLGLSWTLPGAR